MLDWTGKKLGNYHVAQVLARNVVADVYLGQHVDAQTEAAIKVFHGRLTDSDVRTFLQEAQSIANLAHPNLVRLLEFGAEDNTPYLITDYFPDGSLRRRHPQGTSIYLSSCAHYVQQIAEGLNFAHERKIIHRDVKPENFMIGQQGWDTILLGDFGTAALVHSLRYQRHEDSASSVAYSPPEQIQGHANEASDQYALGVAAYEWLTGELPYRGSYPEIAQQHFIAPIPTICDKIPSVPRAVEAVIQKALAKYPEQRYADIGEFSDALTAAASEHAVTTYPGLVPIALPTEDEDITYPGLVPITLPAEETMHQGSQPTPTAAGALAATDSEATADGVHQDGQSALAAEGILTTAGVGAGAVASEVNQAEPTASEEATLTTIATPSAAQETATREVPAATASTSGFESASLQSGESFASEEATLTNLAPLSAPPEMAAAQPVAHETMLADIDTQPIAQERWAADEKTVAIVAGAGAGAVGAGLVASEFGQGEPADSQEATLTNFHAGGLPAQPAVQATIPANASSSSTDQEARSEETSGGSGFTSSFLSPQPPAPNEMAGGPTAYDNGQTPPPLPPRVATVPPNRAPRQEEAGIFGLDFALIFVLFVVLIFFLLANLNTGLFFPPAQGKTPPSGTTQTTPVPAVTPTPAPIATATTAPTPAPTATTASTPAPTATTAPTPAPTATTPPSGQIIAVNSQLVCQQKLNSDCADVPIGMTVKSFNINSSAKNTTMMYTLTSPKACSAVQFVTLTLQDATGTVYQATNASQTFALTAGQPLDMAATFALVPAANSPYTLSAALSCNLIQIHYGNMQYKL